MPVRPEPEMADTTCWLVISAAFSTEALNGLTEAANSWADAARVETDPDSPNLGDAMASLPLLDHTRIGSETELTNDKGPTTVNSRVVTHNGPQGVQSRSFGRGRVIL